MLLSDKTDFRANKSTRGREGDCIMMTRGLIHQEDSNLNVYTSNSRDSKYMN